MYLYRTRVGVRAINYIGDKFAKALHVLKYVMVVVGLGLMSIMIYLLGHIVYTYIKFPQITEIIKAPPLVPVIPYFPRLFGVENLFPPFYFIYFILAFAIVAIVHEFSHGIFMRLFKIKIKSTGFAFLGPILGAFVEEDKGQFEKKSKLEQMSVLGAGTFANAIFALLFYGLLVGFFLISFAPSGYIFNNYAFSTIPMSQVSGFAESSTSAISNNLTIVFVGNETYFLDETLKTQIENKTEIPEYIIAYDDAPAIRAGLEGVIVGIDNTKINNEEDLKEFLINKNPGEEIRIITDVEGEEKEFDLVLSKHPLNNSLGYIGIGFSKMEAQNFIAKVLLPFMKFKELSTNYAPKGDGSFIIFIYNLLWWVMIINLLVALFNMLPLGILDGGRFFYLTVLSITGSDRFAKSLFKIMTYAILFVFFLLMFFWFVRVF